LCALGRPSVPDAQGAPISETVRQTDSAGPLKSTTNDTNVARMNSKKWSGKPGVRKNYAARGDAENAGKKYERGIGRGYNIRDRRIGGYATNPSDRHGVAAWRARWIRSAMIGWVEI
jgi:hypothetical protein